MPNRETRRDKLYTHTLSFFLSLSLCVYVCVWRGRGCKITIPRPAHFHFCLSISSFHRTSRFSYPFDHKVTKPQYPSPDIPSLLSYLTTPLISISYLYLHWTSCLAGGGWYILGRCQAAGEDIKRLGFHFRPRPGLPIVGN